MILFFTKCREDTQFSVHCVSSARVFIFLWIKYTRASANYRTGILLCLEHGVFRGNSRRKHFWREKINLGLWGSYSQDCWCVGDRISNFEFNCRVSNIKRAREFRPSMSWSFLKMENFFEDSYSLRILSKWTKIAVVDQGRQWFSKYLWRINFQQVGIFPFDREIGIATRFNFNTICAVYFESGLNPFIFESRYLTVLINLKTLVTDNMV